ncbi:hypothetical protein [Streptomyces apocyni]|uniref:hypothetical protein n=1 Tax=Streptomyces apocyni TaxID=2654677 RepID=UPI0012EAFF74|nr:hypothetical protein [Streptomyces apocyni]
MSRRTDDYDRSARLISDAADYGEGSGSDVEFASLVVNSLLEQSKREEQGTYPPAGHDYPRTDR